MSAVFGPTIQGEGKSSGREVMFVRLSMCNLHCIWCDTPYTWNWTGTRYKHPLKFDKSAEMHEMSVDTILEQLQQSDCKSVVISGGEPLLQQVELIDLVSKLKFLGYWVEVETNGTIILLNEFVRLVDQFNCSPKLSNSGDPYKLRVRHEPLRAFVASGKTNFKFVITCDEDIAEVLMLVQMFKMQDVYLMPEGITKDKLEANEVKVRLLCQQYGFTFSQRIHITQLGGGRLV